MHLALDRAAARLNVWDEVPAPADERQITVKTRLKPQQNKRSASIVPGNERGASARFDAANDKTLA